MNYLSLLVFLYIASLSYTETPSLSSIEKVEKKQKISSLRTELGEDGKLRKYYIDYTYGRSGKFKQWKTEKVYIENDVSISLVAE